MGLKMRAANKLSEYCRCLGEHGYQQPTSMTMMIINSIYPLMGVILTAPKYITSNEVHHRGTQKGRCHAEGAAVCVPRRHAVVATLPWVSKG